jgi:hypothetical protein
VLNHRQLSTYRWRGLFFVSGCELEGLLFCEIGWQLKMDGETRFKGQGRQREQEVG